MTNLPRRVQFRNPNGPYHTRYLELADHPHQSEFGLVKRTVRVDRLIDGYRGPVISLEFDKDGFAIGIEILYSLTNEEIGEMESVEESEDDLEV